MPLHEDPHWKSMSDGSIGKIRNTTGDCLFMFISWTILYAVYDKCLHIFLRRMHYPLIKRRKIINALWSIGFTLLSTIYLSLFVPSSIDSICIYRRPRYLELGITFHTSFYLHRAALDIIYYRGWLSGWTSMVFCLIIHSASQLKWFDIIVNLLFFKATSLTIVNICRILATVKPKKMARVIQVLVGCHFLNLIYVHTLVVPDFTLWNAKGVKNDFLTLVFMWLWLFMEFLNEVKHIRLGYLNAHQWIDAYLFVTPSEEAMELRQICKKLRETNYNSPEDVETRKNAQLWQTLSCAMMLKKKVKRLRAKKDNLNTSEPS